MIKGKSIGMLLAAGVLPGIFAAAVAFGQSDQQQVNPEMDEHLQVPVPTSSSGPATISRSRSPYVSSQRSKHAEDFYQGVWGIENLEVRQAASGDLLRFSYRVTDANKAQMLNDKKATPYLIDQNTGAVLQVPTMPKVGMLRQTADPVNGREYWMVFSNKGFVKPGSRVDVVVGNFRASGLVVR